MTIEVRQMLIKSTVEDEGGEPKHAASCREEEEREEMKREVLAACIEQLTKKMRDERER